MLKLIERSEPEPGIRPHAEYRRALRSNILSFAPESLLDIGCGDGALMRALRQDGIPRCVGIEPDEALAAAARDEGTEVHIGRAEALPFADASFDVVTLEYVTHHFEQMARALGEAMRVARRAVLILDGWHDDDLPSQHAARLLDEWHKAIDRRLGFVHNPCPSAPELAAPFLVRGGFVVDYCYRLRLAPVSIADAEEGARRRLEEVGVHTGLAGELEHILDLARLRGLTDDGALFLTASRVS